MNKKIIAIMAVVAAVFGIGWCTFFNGDKAADEMNMNQDNKAILETISKGDFEAKYLAMKDGGAQIIDVRTDDEYAQGHYEGATIIDFYAPDFKEQINMLDKKTPHFIHCRSGARSGQALKIMRDLGFTEVYDLAGGFAQAQDILTIVK